MKKLYGLLSLGLLATAGCQQDKYIFDSYSTMRFDALKLPAAADTMALRTVDFVSAAQGYVGGDQGAFFATTDAGQTWTRMASLGTRTVHKLLFTSPTAGWAGTDAGLYRTTNGGQSWAYVPTYNGYGSAGGSILDVQFVTPQVGYAVGTQGAISKTTNGGATWTTTHRYYYKVYTFRAVSFSSVDSGTVVGDEYAKWTTTNGGQTWSVLDGSPAGSGVDRQYDVLRFNEKSYLLALAGGLQAYAPAYSYGQRPDDGFGYPAYGLATAGPRGPVVAVGERTIIRQRAADAAPDSAPWVYVHAPDGTSFTEKFYAADFADSGTFYAVGARGLIYRFHYQ
ncbi:YCF48-related protein [Hymenobacter sp. DH14]|uniref:YCF48-related protein n=1 Tax=Hymenobacter cyanobacteriorum TaxID=2926463 RepID=A0A9X2AIX7_9BACT|nr:YCF48-related protein [Hymenobacter cyanobacteriorum]MCI1189160.1 YCF48-related protein [Hymenobacter cyanobacteriorum]